MSAGRKVFHCAVDDTALTTNISEIKKWTANGAITLVVPLYTLERLHALKRASSQVAINAREAVRFLDRVTSGKDHIPADRVVLQGPMEQYENWEDAENFFLPEFEEEPEAVDAVTNDLLSETFSSTSSVKDPSSTSEDPPSGDLAQILLSKLNFKREPDSVSVASNGTHSAPGSPRSSGGSRTSPECNGSQSMLNGSCEVMGVSRSNGHRRTASGSAIPTAPAVLRPLLSALLWRLHSGPDASSTAKSCILITNDRTAQTWAQKFGIGVKNIHQLRTAIQYEEREYKNRCKYVEKTQYTPNEPKTLLSYDEESEEDELVFIPRTRGKGPPRLRANHLRKPADAKIPAVPVETPFDVPIEPIDPDSFNRTLGVIPSNQSSIDLSTQAGAARGLASASRRQSRGGRGSLPGRSHASSRGRGKLWVP